MRNIAQYELEKGINIAQHELEKGINIAQHTHTHNGVKKQRQSDKANTEHIMKEIAKYVIM